MFPSDTTAYPAHPRLDQIVQSPGHPHNTNILLLYAPFLNLIPRQGTYLPNNLCSMGLFNTTPEVFPAAHFPTQGWVQCDPLYPSEDYNAPHQQANSAQDKQPGPTSESSIYNQDPYDPVYAAWSPLEEQPGSTFSHAEEVPPVSWQVGNPATIPDYHPIWQSGSRASTEAAVQHLPGFDHDRFDEAGISLAVNVEAPPQLYRHSHRASSSSLWDCSEMVPDIEMNTTVQEQCRSSTPSLTSIPAVVSEVPEATSPRPTCRLSEQQISTPQHEKTEEAQDCSLLFLPTTKDSLWWASSRWSNLPSLRYKKSSVRLPEDGRVPAHGSVPAQGMADTAQEEIILGVVLSLAINQLDVLTSQDWRLMTSGTFRRNNADAEIASLNDCSGKESKAGVIGSVDDNVDQYTATASKRVNSN
ncbi:hypothetical protein BDN72DRAFT_863531 [Pluteus cervinus]|uniref:Uncharacterized protein n=1 Tax=Pluteus cervinus TaxID=181527 RepID=A0ACD3A7M0_9AGAR|nr:hypothetical protein BDN72DRAFT_863531 [Pluteus cervinus]